MEYIEILKNLTEILNPKRNKEGIIKRDKEDTKKFLECLSELKENFGISLSDKFLKNLISKENKKKSNYLKHFLKKAGITIKKEVRFYREDRTSIRKIEVVEYEHSEKRKVYNHFPRYAFNDDMSLKKVVKMGEVLGFESRYINGIRKRNLKLNSKKERVVTGEEVLGLYNAINSIGVNQKKPYFIEVAKDYREPKIEILNTLQI